MDMVSTPSLIGEDNTTHADYTFVYHKLDGRVLISSHHSSLTWIPSVTD